MLIPLKLALQQLLNSPKKATAFIGVNDMTALGIMSYLHEMNYSVPEDYSVAGFDNIFVSSVAVPSMTTVEHHLSLRGQSAVDMIIGKKRDNSSHDSTHLLPQINKIEYEPYLIVRNSTGKVRD